jgi:TonB family protein
MKARVKSARLGLACLIMFGCAAALVPRATAQDGSEQSKRKVKTKVVPDYPNIAKQLSLQGKVRIETTIAPDGHVTTTKVVGGNPVLASAATDAVKKWRFEIAAKETTEVIEIDFAGRN